MNNTVKILGLLCRMEDAISYARNEVGNAIQALKDEGDLLDPNDRKELGYYLDDTEDFFRDIKFAIEGIKRKVTHPPENPPTADH